MLQVMKEYGWDFHTYMNQPSYILDLAHKKLAIEARLAAKAAEKPRYGTE